MQFLRVSADAEAINPRVCRRAAANELKAAGRSLNALLLRTALAAAHAARSRVSDLHLLFVPAQGKSIPAVVGIPTGPYKLQTGGCGGCELLLI